MNDQQINDRNMILIILGTILLVFILIFTFIPSRNQLPQPIEWKDTPSQNSTPIKANMNKGPIY